MLAHVGDPISKTQQVDISHCPFRQVPAWLEKRPESHYTDPALTPVPADEFDSCEMFSTSEAAKSAVMNAASQRQPVKPSSRR